MKITRTESNSPFSFFGRFASHFVFDRVADFLKSDIKGRQDGIIIANICFPSMYVAMSTTILDITPENLRKFYMFCLSHMDPIHI